MTEVDNLELALDQLIARVGHRIIMATPLGIGKPNGFLNALYQRVKNNPELDLTLLTALSLQVPEGQSDLEKGFLDPMTQRVFAGYPDLLYERERRNNRLPANIKVIEFYFQAGQYKSNPEAQRDYLASNYTHVVRDVFDRGVNAICQQVAEKQEGANTLYSLSSNPDLTIDLEQLCQQAGRPIFKVAQINQALPFMYGESVVTPSFFDVIVKEATPEAKLFSPPKMAVSAADAMIGLHVSSLIKDDGEIQIGIGSLGDALAYSLCLRHNENEIYQDILKDCAINGDQFPVLQKEGATDPFNKGLFAATEMLVDSFAALYKAGLLKKKVYDHVIIQRLLNQNLISEDFSDDVLQVLINHRAIHSHLTQADFLFLKDFGIFKSQVHWHDDHLVYNNLKVWPDLNNSENLNLIKQSFLGHSLRNGAVVHAGFFLGPQSFYDFLHQLPLQERKLFRMKRISQINHLYGHEEIDRLQRTNGRFINTCMKVSLNGAACSDALASGEQISGVGGQYNFVAMAHELPQARSILQLRSTRINGKGKLESNILFNYANCTIPRHLRDIVVTEYGIADLRGKTDEEVAIALIQVADSRFQSALIAQAKKANKLPHNFQLNERYCHNRPDKYRQILNKYQKRNYFLSFPFGTDFTEEEIKLGQALKYLQALTRKLSLSLLVFVVKAFLPSSPTQQERQYLQRMGFKSHSRSLRDWIMAKILLQALRHGPMKPN